MIGSPMAAVGLSADTPPGVDPYCNNQATRATFLPGELPPAFEPGAFGAPFGGGMDQQTVSSDTSAFAVFAHYRH